MLTHTGIYSLTYSIWCNICQWWNSANNFTRNLLNTWKSLTNSLLTGYQCQLLTLGHSWGIIGVKLKCTYSEAPQMFAEQIIHLCRRGGLGALMNAPPRPNLGWAQRLGGSPGSNGTAVLTTLTFAPAPSSLLFKCELVQQKYILYCIYVFEAE